MRHILAALLALTLSACQPAAETDGAINAVSQPPPQTRMLLRVASWNMEHLAEANGSGCRPREDADYAALRNYAQTLNADVVAIQEVESVAAAQRVFDPAIYDILMEARPGTPNSAPPCKDMPGLHLNRQATGFAVKKGLAVDRHADVTSLQAGDPNLRSGVDITVTASHGAPVRLLSVHLKSGCAGGPPTPACETLLTQAHLLEDWIDARGRETARFAILGDFNRRLALADDPVWAVLDGPVGPTDLSLAAGKTPPSCDPRYTSFIDHIVVDPRIAAGKMAFSELRYTGERLSDHCAVSIDIPR